MARSKQIETISSKVSISASRACEFGQGNSAMSLNLPSIISVNTENTGKDSLFIIALIKTFVITVVN